MNYRIYHLGAEHGVTGSCHLLQAGGLNIMVDCGVSQGDDRPVPMIDWPVKPSEIDFLFLTHAHIDHIGRVPELVEKGFKGEILCTHPTKALLLPMLADAMGFSNRPKYEIHKLSRAIDDLSWGFEYDQSFTLKKGVAFKLGIAGHILGSCFIRFEFRNFGWSVIFSGDIGPKDTPILPDPAAPESCDVLILESTYGDRVHEDRKGRLRRLGEVLTSALSDGGKVLIPSFALGRTQELIYEMDRLFSDPAYGQAFPALNQQRRIPVFLDSPLGLEITQMYSRLAEFWDKETREIQFRGDHPLDFDQLYAVKTRRDHLRLLDLPGPAIIVAGSGMCAGGRILDHLAKGLQDAKNDIFFVGYQGRGTKGREIICHSTRPGGYVYLNGKRLAVKANVHTLTGYSAHADQTGLMEWVKSMPDKPAKIKLVHGETIAQTELKRLLAQEGYNVQ